MRGFIDDFKIYILPIVSGLLLAATQPFVDATFFIWFAFIPFLHFIHQSESRKVILIGAFYTGIIYWGVALYPLFTLNAWWWLDIPILYENRIIIWFLGITILVLYGAIIQFCIFSLAGKSLIEKKWSSLIFLPLTWTSLEIVREYTIQGFTWGHIGYMLHNHEYLLQLSSFGGVYILSFLVILVNLALYKFLYYVVQYKHKSYNNKQVWFYGVTLTVVLIVGNIVGYSHINKEISFNEKVSVIIIQDNIDTREVKRADVQSQFDRMSKALENNPTLLILPENTFPFYTYLEGEGMLYRDPIFSLPEDQVHFEQFVTISERYASTSIIFGMNTYDKNNKKKNAVLVLENGEITSIYHKREQLPFSERGFLQYSPFGKDKVVLSTQNIQFEPLICSEVSYPRLLGSNSSDFIIILGNDGVFSSPLVAKTHHRMAKFRAVENGKFILRSMKTGISSIISPYGQIVSIVKLNENGSIQFPD